MCETEKQNPKILNSKTQRTDWQLLEAEDGGGWVKWVKGVNRYKCPARKQLSPEAVMYSIVNIVTNTIAFLNVDTRIDLRSPHYKKICNYVR